MKESYIYSLSDLNKRREKRGTVFSCFAGAGGSSIGYKMAGYEVIGCNEVDPRMIALYKENLKPKYAFCEPIQTFRLREDLPPELYQLDLLDGSPPCSTFSSAGLMEQSWGVKKRFREGQIKQVLDTLFFDLIALADKLRPKIVVAENVKGLLFAKAKKYVERIYREFDEAGYHCRHYLLDAQKMGVPQRRERVFFIALRKDLGALPELKIEQGKATIPISEIADYKGREVISEIARLLWNNRVKGDVSLAKANMRLRGKQGHFSHMLAYSDRVCPTLTTKQDGVIYYDRPLLLSRDEVVKASSFPSDYNFLNQSFQYVCGMSVPPLMLAHVADAVYRQVLSRLSVA